MVSEIPKEAVEKYRKGLEKCCLEDREKNKGRRIAELRARYKGILDQAVEIGAGIADGRYPGEHGADESVRANLELRIKVVAELRALGEKIEDEFAP